MFFTMAGRIVAWLACVFGALQVIGGVYLAQFDNFRDLAMRYLGTPTTGKAIDQGVMLLVFGIGIGILTDISRSVKTRD